MSGKEERYIFQGEYCDDIVSETEINCMNIVTNVVIIIQKNIKGKGKNIIWNVSDEELDLYSKYHEEVKNALGSQMTEEQLLLLSRIESIKQLCVDETTNPRDFISEPMVPLGFEKKRHCNVSVTVIGSICQIPDELLSYIFSNRNIIIRFYSNANTNRNGVIAELNHAKVEYHSHKHNYPINVKINVNGNGLFAKGHNIFLEPCS